MSVFLPVSYGLLPSFVSFRSVVFFSLYFSYFSCFPQHSFIFLLFLFPVSVSISSPNYLSVYSFYIVLTHLFYDYCCIHPLRLLYSFSFIIPSSSTLSTVRLGLQSSRRQSTVFFSLFPSSASSFILFLFFSICYVRLVVFHCLLFSLLLHI
jgi:hypothetical protein